MANPTRSELFDQLKEAFRVLEETRKYGSVNSPNFLELRDDVVTGLNTDFDAGVTAALRAQRASLNSVITNGDRIISPIMRGFGKYLDIPETDNTSILLALYDDLIDTGDTVQSRDVVFGAITPGAVTGTGEIVRLTIDKDGFGRDNVYAETKTLRIEADAANGQNRNQELFSVRGSNRAIDEIERTGSGILGNFEASDDEASLLLNASFDNFAGADPTQPTAITNWASDITVDGTNYEFDDTSFYLPARDDFQTRYSLKVKNSAVLTQKQTLFNQPILQDTPYYAVVHYEENATATGTIELKMGAVTSGAIALVAGTGWKKAAVVVGTDQWFPTFNETDLDIEIDITLSAGEVNIDDVIFVPMVEVDGTFWVAIPGQTPFAFEDEWTVADTETGAVINQWLWRLLGGYLPHSNTPTILDP